MKQKNMTIQQRYYHRLRINKLTVISAVCTLLLLVASIPNLALAQSLPSISQPFGGVILYFVPLAVVTPTLPPIVCPAHIVIQPIGGGLTGSTPYGLAVVEPAAFSFLYAFLLNGWTFFSLPVGSPVLKPGTFFLGRRSAIPLTNAFGMVVFCPDTPILYSLSSFFGSYFLGTSR